MKISVWDGITVCETLKKVAGSPSDQFTDFLEIIRLMKFPDDGRPEFIFYSAAKKKVNTLFYRFKVDFIQSDGHSVLFRTVFYIHRDVIHKAIVQDFFKKCRMIAVGIKFNGIPQFSDPDDQIIQTGMKAGLTSGNGNTVKKTLTLFKERKKFFLGHNGRGRAVHKFIVVAVWTSKITPSKEDSACDTPRKIQEGHFLKSVYFHGSSFQDYLNMNFLAAAYPMRSGSGRTALSASWIRSMMLRPCGHTFSQCPHRMH